MVEFTTSPTYPIKSVLIVTYGRSGSTLLQGLLNRIPGYRITGENNNFLYWMYQSAQQLQLLKEFEFAMHAHGPEHAYYGVPEANFESFYELCSAIAYRFIVPESKIATTRCYGFKEIRYVDFPEETSGYLDFLRSIFPSCKIVFNTRNLDDVRKSGWWSQQDQEKTKQVLSHLEAMFDDYLRKNAANCFHITYEDLIGNAQRVRELFLFLGEDYSDEFLASALNTPHSTRG